jgi:hypothetical protein
MPALIDRMNFGFLATASSSFRHGMETTTTSPSGRELLWHAHLDMGNARAARRKAPRQAIGGVRETDVQFVFARKHASPDQNARSGK